MNKLLSALAKGHFAISEEGLQAYFPIVQAILAGTYVPKAEDLPEDEFYDDEPVMAEADEVTGRIVLMRVTGVLLHYGGMCSYGTEDYAARLNAYAQDDSVSGVIVLADTPGGMVDGIETLREAVIGLRSKKPIYTIINDGRIASGGIWGFAASTKIFALNSICSAGSIGVMCVMNDIRKAMEMEGIKQVIFRAPQSKDKNKVTEDALEGRPAELLAELSFLCDRFLEVVQTDRGDKLTTDEWNTGKMFFASEAVRIGLIDGIKNFAEVMAEMQQDIAQNQNSNNMFKRFPKVAALSGVETITAESLEAANNEIEAFGIAGVTLCLDSDLADLHSSAGSIATLQASITAKDGELATANTTITDLTNKVTALQAKVDGKPAVDPASPAAAADVIQGTEEVSAEFETSVDRELKALDALYKIK